MNDDQDKYRAKCTARRTKNRIEEKNADGEWENVSGSPFGSINAAKRASRNYRHGTLFVEE